MFLKTLSHPLFFFFFFWLIRTLHLLRFCWPGKHCGIYYFQCFFPLQWLPSSILFSFLLVFLQIFFYLAFLSIIHKKSQQFFLCLFLLRFYCWFLCVSFCQCHFLQTTHHSRSHCRLLNLLFHSCCFPLSLGSTHSALPAHFFTSLVHCPSLWMVFHSSTSSTTSAPCNLTALCAFLSFTHVFCLILLMIIPVIQYQPPTFTWFFRQDKCLEALTKQVLLLKLSTDILDFSVRGLRLGINFKMTHSCLQENKNTALTNQNFILMQSCLTKQYKRWMVATTCGFSVSISAAAMLTVWSQGGDLG